MYKPEFPHTAYARFINILPCLAVLIVLLLLSLVPINIAISKDARPMLLLMGVFYWALFRPAFLGIFGLFAIGFIYDSFAGNPLGQTSLILIATHLLVKSQRKLLLHQPFWILWLVYAVLALFAGFFSCILHMVLIFDLVPVVPYLLDILVSISFFPFAALFLKLTNPPLAQHIKVKN